MHCLQWWITITFYLFKRGIYDQIFIISQQCAISALFVYYYCKLTSREFHVKSMWRTTRESFPRKSLRNEWLKSYIKNSTENTKGINVDSLVISNLKKKDSLELFHLKCVKHSWQSVWVWTNNLTLLLFTSL